MFTIHSDKFVETDENNRLLKDHDDDYEDEINNLKSEHDSLIKNLSKIYATSKNHLWKSTRLEAQPELEKHGMSKSKRSKVTIDKLLKLSNNSKSKKSLRNFKKKKVLFQPLRKPIANKIARQINFKELNEEISKYDQIVKKVRHASQLVFPAEDEKLIFKISSENTSDNSKANATSIQNIEKNINDEIVKNEENVESDEKFLTENELQVLKSLSLEEARKLHKEIQRRRILVSFQEAKFRRIRKIKSKKYHRFLKKDKLKNIVQEFEKSLEENSAKAVEKLDELDRLRALERASLKHMNTGKWAKHNMIRAKYNEQSRNELNEQLKLNQAMMKKRSLSLLDNEDNIMDVDFDNESVLEIDNNKIETSSNKNQDLSFVEVPHNYNPWSSVQDKKRIKLPIQQNETTYKSSNNKNTSLEKCISKRIAQKIQNAKMDELNEIIERDMVDERIIDEGVNEFEIVDSKSKSSCIDDESSNDDNDQHQNLNSNSFINKIEDVKKMFQASHDPEDDEQDEFNVDDVNFSNNESAKYLREAFADDDVIEQFKKEKKQQENIEIKPKHTYLPGWGGGWSGFGIKETRRKKLKEKNKVLLKKKKLDKQICNAIFLDISKNNKMEKIDPKRQQQIIKPIGSLWNPQSTSKALQEPKIITRSGSIIEPMKPVVL